jgi:nucleotide-binding universal stress UspA family protein
MYSTLLWATDGSPESDGALATALELLAPGGRIIAFHVDERFRGSRVGGAPVLVDELDRVKHIEQQVQKLQDDGLDARLFIETTSRSAAHEIADVADRLNTTAIVCGTRGLHGLRGFLGGSVTSELLHQATVPVIVVPAGAHDRESVEAGVTP